MQNLYKQYHPLIFGISVVSLIIAYFVEYIMQLVACPLCIYQRFPYLLLIAVSLMALQGSKKRYYYWYIIIFAISIFLAAYHTGVERGLFELSSFCKPAIQITDNLSVMEFRQSLENQPISACDKPALTIIGLSMTEWNLFLSIVLFMMNFVMIIKNKQDA